MSAAVDPRGQRFAAALTALVLLVALVVAPSTTTIVLLALQAAVFAVGAFVGPARTPYAWVFRTLVRPRLGPPTETEDARPPQFAQGVGLAFAVVALVGYGLDVTLLGAVAAGMALAAALLNATVGFCLGCEMYLLIKRITTNTGRSPVAERTTT